MSTPVSNISSTDFFNLIKNALPLRKQSDDNTVKRWLNLALSRLNAFYVNNDKGVYNAIGDFDFYNSASALINIKDETRWCQIIPTGFYARKLNSCMLKSASPVASPLPPAIAYLQDIDISIVDSKDSNASVPSANKGNMALVEGVGFYNSLTLDDTDNTWQNIMIITCVVDYYRNIIYPNYLDANEKIDVQVADFELVSAYVNEFASRPSIPDSFILKTIQDREFQIKYGTA